MIPSKDNFDAEAAGVWQAVVRQSHEVFFAGQSKFALDREHGEDRIPQPGLIGTSFRPRGLLLLGQNPGGGRDGFSENDQKHYDLLRALRDAPNRADTQTAYCKLMRGLESEIMPNWRIIKNVVRPLLDCLNISLDRTAYVNFVKFRTEVSTFDRDLYDRAWPLTSKQISILDPQFIVALGAKVYKAIQRFYSGPASVHCIHRSIGDFRLPPAGHEDIRAICEKLIEARRPL